MVNTYSFFFQHPIIQLHPFDDYGFQVFAEGFLSFQVDQQLGGHLVVAEVYFADKIRGRALFYRIEGLSVVEGQLRQNDRSNVVFDVNRSDL